MYRRAFLFGLVLITAAERATAQETFQSLIPEDFDISGIWVLDPRPSPGDQAIFDRCDHELGAKQNFPMYGRAWMELRATDARYEFIQFDTPKLILTYEGTFHHFQGYGAFSELDPEMRLWRTDRSCYLEPIDYSFTGELRYHLADVLTFFTATGPAITVTPYQHASERAVANSIQGNNIFAPILHLRYDGDVIAVNFGAGLQVNENSFPAGCNTFLIEPANGFSLTECQPLSGFSWIMRKRNAPPDVISKGTLGGVLIEGLPDGTEQGDPIISARVTLFQQTRALREQGSAESDTDYAAYVAGERGKWKKIAETRPDMSGRFSFTEVPDLAYAENERGLRRALFAIAVSDAEKEELNDEGEMETLPFIDALKHGNVTGDDVRIVMIPGVALLAKYELATRLGEIAPQQYEPIEQRARLHAYQLLEGLTPVTPQLLEGVKRGVWAERAVLIGTEFAKLAIEIYMGILMEYAGEALSKHFSTTSGDLAKDGEKYEELLKARNKTAVTSKGFQWNDDSFDKINAEMNKVLENNGDLAAQKTFEKLTTAFNTAFVYLRIGLIKAGFPETDADSLIENMQTYFFDVLAVLVSGDRGAIYNFILAQTEDYLVDLMFDSVYPFCYTADTSESLQLAYDQMVSWPNDDLATYLVERDAVVAEIRAISDNGTRLLKNLAYAQGFSEGVGNAADVYEMIPVPAFQRAAKLATKTKQLTDAVTALAAVEYAMAKLPDDVDRAVRRAFGLPERTRLEAVPGAGRTVPIGPQVRIDFAIAEEQLLAKIRAHRSKLEGNDLEGMIETLAGEEGILPAAENYNRAFLAFHTQLGGAYLDRPPVEEGLITVLVRQHGIMQAIEETLYVERPFLISAMAGEIDFLSGEYAANRTRIRARWASVSTALGDVFAPQVSILAAGDQYPVKPAVVVDPLLLTSDATARRVATTNPEAFTLRTTLRSVSTGTIAAFEAHLVVKGADGRVLVNEPMIQSVGPFAGNDGLPGGPDEQELIYTIDYSGDLTALDDVLFRVELKENGATPRSFISDNTSTVLTAAPELRDTDSDGFADHYERMHGLDPAIDDSRLDKDSDGLANRTELHYRTSPSDADSDDDGLSDGEESIGGSDGFITDPLAGDTDGDGANDDVDRTPDDGSTTGASPIVRPEPIVSIDETELVLDTDAFAAVIKVNNAGEGTLLWSAVPVIEHPLIEVTPKLPDIKRGGEYMTVRLAGAALSTDRGFTELRVVDVGGATPDEVVLRIYLNEKTAPESDAGVITEDGGGGGAPKPSEPDAGMEASSGCSCSSTQGRW